MRPRITQLTVMTWRLTGPMLLAGLAVLFMVIITAVPAELQAAGKFTSLLLGDKADANGVVAKHMDKFTPTTPEIYGTAKITGLAKGQKVTADLLYGPQNLKALTITKDIKGSGDITFTFAFSKPTKGWPPGDYKVVISTSDGAKKEVPFQVK
jgi:hypothetical protein